MKKKRQPVSRQALYNTISSYSPDIIARLIKMTKSKNENVALGACKTLLNKALPDLNMNAMKLEALVTTTNDTIEEKTDKIDMSEMTDEQKKDYGMRMIEAGEAIAGVGKYAPRTVDEFAEITVENNAEVTLAPEKFEYDYEYESDLMY